MKRIWYLLLLCAVFICGTEPSIQVEYLSGQKLDLAIKAIGRITCTNHQLQLVDKKGEVLGTGDLDQAVIRFTGKEPPMAIDEIASSSRRLVVYPNPTSDVLFIEGTAATSTIRVFSMEGTFLQSATGNQINVSTLPKGAYLLQVETDVVKFIKK